MNQPSMIILRIQMTNAAFQDGASGHEVAAILRSLADRIDGETLSASDDTKLLKDTNGNIVGHFDVHA
jgi:hypothetical protein